MNPLNHTTCKYCVFKIVDGEGLQTGCSANRLDKFKEEEKAVVKEGEDSFSISALCNSCRNEDWYNYQVKLGKNLLKTMQEENGTFEAIISAGPNDTWADVRNSLDSLKGIKKVYFAVHLNVKLSNTIISELTTRDIKWDVTDSYEGPNKRLAEIFGKVRTEYCIFLKAGQKYDKKAAPNNKVISGPFINTEIGAKMQLVADIENFDFVEAVRKVVAEWYMRPDLL